MIKKFFSIFNIRSKAVKLFLLIFIVSISIVSLHLQIVFGKQPTMQQRATFYSVPYYNESGFISPKAIIYNKDNAVAGGLWRFFFSSPEAPNMTLPKEILDNKSFDSNVDDFSIRWLGHSSAIIELSKKRFLIDPVFENAAFIQGLVRRYDASPIRREDLPKLDAVIITHDHYDHLEYATIRYLSETDVKFIVPLGVGSRLIGWGVREDKICELGWDDSIKVGEVNITALPAIHYSGRHLLDKNSTLWAAYAIKSNDMNIFWSGDTGYGEHFSKIGEKYGPFDLACMEIDGWNPGWPHSHLFPSEVVKATKELGAKALLPIHWAVFDLAFHPWTQSVEEVLKRASGEYILVITPKMGEKINNIFEAKIRWWRTL